MGVNCIFKYRFFGLGVSKIPAGFGSFKKFIYLSIYLYLSSSSMFLVVLLVVKVFIKVC